MSDKIGADANKENMTQVNLAKGEEGRGKKTGQQDNLFTRVVNFDGRSYYLDVRENARGQYLKLTESSQRRRSTILLSGYVVGILVQILDDAIKDNLDSKVPAGQTESDSWVTVFSRKSVTMQKKIYFDLMVNKFGRSLNIAEISPNRPKTAVIISEHGWFQLQRALKEVVEQFPGFQPPSPRGDVSAITSKKLSLQSKTFFFDLMEGELGKFLKLSELRKGKRETLFIPDVCFPPLVSLLGKLLNNNINDDIDGMETAECPASATEAEGHETLARWILSVQAEDDGKNKTFHLDLRKNHFGKFLRITELRPGRSSAVFLPEDAFLDAKSYLEEFASL